jgi:hypothetical protein
MYLEIYSFLHIYTDSCMAAIFRKTIVRVPSRRAGIYIIRLNKPTDSITHYSGFLLLWIKHYPRKDPSQISLKKLQVYPYKSYSPRIVPLTNSHVLTRKPQHARPSRNFKR